jgi:hypothetical protein
MNQLFPIIRRARRPLLPTEPVVGKQAEPAATIVPKEPATQPAAVPKEKTNNGESTEY